MAHSMMQSIRNGCFSKEQEDRLTEMVSKGIAESKARASLATEQLDSVLGYGDKEEELEDKWFEQQMEQYFDDKKKLDDAVERVKEANLNGRTKFEELISIANENGINTDRFLEDCGFKNIEELREQKDVINQALINYSLINGQFEDSEKYLQIVKVEGNNYIQCSPDDIGARLIFNGKYEVDKDGMITNPSLSRTIATFDTMATVYGYVNGYDMVSTRQPFFISESGKVSDTYEFFEDEVFPGLTQYIDKDDDSSKVSFDAMTRVFDGTYEVAGNRYNLWNNIKKEYKQPSDVVSVLNDDGEVVGYKLKNAEKNLSLVAERLSHEYGNVFDFEALDSLHDLAFDDLNSILERFDDCYLRKNLKACLDNGGDRLDVLSVFRTTHDEYMRDLFEAYLSSYGYRRPFPALQYNRPS